MAFRLLTSHKALIFQMISPTLVLQDAENCKTEVLKAKGNYTLIMMDLSNVKKVENEPLKVLADLSNALLKQKQRVMVIANDQVTQTIENSGYAEFLPCYVGVTPVIDDAESGPSSLAEIDAVSFLRIVAPAVQDNLRIYAKIAVKTEEPVACKQQEIPEVDIAGVGGFFCNNRKGNVLLCFKTGVFLKIVSAIMRVEYKQMEPAISDWAAELVNSVLGKVKSDLKAKGYSFSSGIPTVFAGKDLEVFYSTKVPTRLDIVKCTCEYGDFYVEVMMATED